MIGLGSLLVVSLAVTPPSTAIASVSPTSGYAAGGDELVLTGSLFTGATDVTIDGVSVAFVVDSDTQITIAATPEHDLGAVTIAVTTPSGTASLVGGFTYTKTIPLTVVAVAPSSALAGDLTPLTLTGTGFRGVTSVELEPYIVGVTFVVDSDTQITLDFDGPGLGAAPGDVVDFRVIRTIGVDEATGSALLTCPEAPSVSSVAPSVGALAGGTAITINGSGFVSGATVTVGGAAATSVVWVSSTQITAVTPAHAAGAVDVVVTNPDTQDSGSSGASAYTYAAAPVVTSITPSSGSAAGGTTITDLHGTGFVSGATVTIGGAAATSVVFVSSVKLTCVAPAGSAGARDVVVTNPDTQTSGASGASLYTYVAAPTITSITQNLGDPLGGSSHVIVGTGFSGATAVKFGATNATSYVVNSSTQITAVLPAHVAGTVDVVVTTGGGTATLTNGFEFWDPSVPATPTVFLDKPDYAIGAPGAGLGRWTKRAGSLASTWDAIAVGSTPAVASGSFPSFPTAPGNYARLDATPSRTIGDVLGYSQSIGFTLAVVIDINAIANGAANPYSGEAIFSDNLFRGHLSLNNQGGTNHLRWYWYAGAYRTLETTLSSLGRVVAILERDVTTDPVHPRMKITIDGTTWVTDTVDAGNITSGDSIVNLGWATDNAQSSVYFDGKIRAFCAVKADWSAANVSRFYKWAAARHP